jgi:hypothetical protein
MWGSAQQTAACTSVLAELRQSGRIAEFKDLLTDVEKQQELRFLANCLGSPDPRVANRLGRLVLNGATLCTVLFLTPTRGITARHCVFDRAPFGGQTFFQPIRAEMKLLSVDFGTVSSARTIRVTAIEVPTTSVGLAKQSLSMQNNYALEAFGPISRDVEQRDFVVIEIAQPMTTQDFAAIPWTEPRFGDRIFLPAYHEPSLLEQNASEDGFRQQVVGFCQVVEPKLEGCMTHACSTTPGASGAPILIEREIQGQRVLHLAGIHTSGKREVTACPGNPGTDTVLNYGVLLTAQDFSQLR